MSVDFLVWDKAIDDAQVDKLKLYDQIQNAIDTEGDSAELRWRLAKACLVLADVALKNKEKELDKKYVYESLEHTKKAMSLDNESALAHKWHCAAVGRVSDFVGTKERIQYGHEFKTHCDIATQKCPEDHLLFHMYGRWCYEVASLNWAERKIAAAFFASPPESTYQDAREALERAHKLSKWKANHLWLAKVAIAEKKYAEAVEWLDKGMALPFDTEECYVAHEDMKKFESKYSRYRK